MKMCNKCGTEMTCVNPDGSRKMHWLVYYHYKCPKCGTLRMGDRKEDYE